MKTTQQFIDALVTIDPINDSKEYGHYPFQLLAVDAENKAELAALDLGGDVKGCYKAFRAYVAREFPYIFMSVDFPAMFDMTTDFVVIFSLVEGNLEVCALPYDSKTGKRYPIVTESKILDQIKSQFQHFVFPS